MLICKYLLFVFTSKFLLKCLYRKAFLSHNITLFPWGQFYFYFNLYYTHVKKSTGMDASPSSNTMLKSRWSKSAYQHCSNLHFDHDRRPVPVQALKIYVHVCSWRLWQVFMEIDVILRNKAIVLNKQIHLWNYRQLLHLMLLHFWIQLQTCFHMPLLIIYD